MKTALIIVAAKFVEDEVLPPYYRLQEAGFKVGVYCASPSQNKYGFCCYGKNGAPIPVTTTIINEALPDLLFIPGGTESTEVLRQDKEILNLVRKMNDANRLCCFYCHGAQVMISAQVTKGRKMTCYKGMMIDLRNSGAEVPDESVRVVVDDNFLSAQHYHDTPEFLRTVVEQYKLRNDVVH